MQPLCQIHTLSEIHFIIIIILLWCVTRGVSRTACTMYTVHQLNVNVILKRQVRHLNLLFCIRQTTTKRQKRICSRSDECPLAHFHVQYCVWVTALLHEVITIIIFHFNWKIKKMKKSVMVFILFISFGSLRILSCAVCRLNLFFSFFHFVSATLNLFFYWFIFTRLLLLQDQNNI